MPDEVEFPFTITVTPGEPQGRAVRDERSPQPCTVAMPRQGGVARMQETVMLIIRIVGALLLIALLILVVRALVLYWPGVPGSPLRRTDVPHVYGVPAGQRVIEITEPDKAARCTGMLVRDETSPRCRDVSNGRWCPNMCKPW